MVSEFISFNLLIILYAISEGFNEYHFWQVNRAAKFSLRQVDSNRKTINAAQFLAFAGAGAVAFLPSDWLWLPALALASGWRWLWLDGILNRKRNLSFWYPGSTGRSFTDRFLQSLRSWQIPLLKIGSIIVLLVATWYCDLILKFIGKLF